MKLTPTSKTFVLAFSGGPDSTYLLRKYQKQIKHVCHVNYNYRPTALRDAVFCKRKAKEMGLPFSEYTVSPETYEKNAPKNFQSWARAIRYNFFLEVVRKHNLPPQILVGHHLDDFLETAYMQRDIKQTDLLFYGIEKNQLWRNELLVHRPLVKKIWRYEIEQYLVKHRLRFCFDETNTTGSYLRTEVRKILQSWTNTEKKRYLHLIKNHNYEFRMIRLEVNKKFAQWIKIEYDLQFLFEQSLLLQEQLLYKLFHWENWYVTHEKINNFLTFIHRNAPRSKKSFKISATCHVGIDKLKLQIRRVGNE